VLNLVAISQSHLRVFAALTTGRTVFSLQSQNQPENVRPEMPFAVRQIIVPLRERLAV
jgi:hypothetical protein